MSAAIDKAERMINAVLAELEASTGQLVDTLDLRSIEITKLDDDRPCWMRTVTIRLTRQPGSEWRP